MVCVVAVDAAAQPPGLSGAKAQARKAAERDDSVSANTGARRLGYRVMGRLERESRVRAPCAQSRCIAAAIMYSAMTCAARSR